MNIENFPKITIIFRNYSYEQIKIVMEVLQNSKIKSVEVAMNTPNAAEIINKLSIEFGNNFIIGAGTVTTLEQAEVAVEAGAKFILSPVMLDKTILDYCNNNSIIAISGAMTPTEIYKSIEDGADIVKVFPAITYEPRFFKDVKAPFAKLPLMAVGGITTDNANVFLKNGADFLGVGSGIFNKEDIITGNYYGLRNSLSEFQNKVVDLL